MSVLAGLFLASAGWAVYAVGTMPLRGGVTTAGLATGITGLCCLVAIGYGVHALA